MLICFIGSVRCSAYILKLADVIRHLFGVEAFAKFAGTRTHAFLDSDFYQHLDHAHNGAISALSPGSAGQTRGNNSNVALGAASPASPSSIGACPTTEVPDSVNADPIDEVMTANGDTMTLFFALFVDGVQLHAHGRATTTVVGVKCLDLPGFLCNTDLASYPLAFIGGSKEPTNMSEIMAIILKQFKNHEPDGWVDDKGMLPYYFPYCPSVTQSVSGARMGSG